MTVVAVVLAGGESRRFGSDKLAARIDQYTVLDHTLDSLPADFTVVVVGPARPTPRPVTHTREDPPGGGPAAGLIAGLRAALIDGPDAVVVLPGDAPAAGRGAVALLAALAGREAVIGIDAAGQRQPLQLALTPAAARRLVELAGPDGAAGQSARRLSARLDPPPYPVTLDPAEFYDIDTPEQMEGWRRLGRRAGEA